MIYLKNNTNTQMISIPRSTVLTDSAVTEYATEEYVDEAIAEAISGITGVTYEAGDNIEISGNVISVTGMPDTSEFVTSGDVQTQIDDSISGKADTSAITGFVTSAEVQTQINDSITGITIPTSNTAFTNDAGYITSGDIPTSNTAFTNDAHYITSGDIPTSNTAFTNDAHYVNSGDVQTQINDSISGLSPYTAGTYIQIQDNVISATGVQETLVSGTNIKTVNNQSVLGEGNITIEGGGEKVVELTYAEYTALTGYASATTYVITDAEYINIDDYAPLSAVTGKADKASVTANTGRLFPRWNTQGVITGTTGNTVYEQGLNINGTSKTMLQTTNSSFGNIYAPTTAGEAAQPLLSNGSGAPV